MKIAIRLLGAGAALLLSVEAKAQVDNPLNWDKFVQSEENVLVSDTFRYQSFDPLEVKGWKYSVGQGEPKIMDISKLKIKNATGRYALQLYPGESVEFANPTHPNGSFDKFVAAISAQVGAALEVPADLLLKQFNSSYSASRAALLEAWKAFKMRREWLADDFCRPCYEVWMSEAVARGRIYAPGFFDNPTIRAAYLGSEWLGPSQGQLDPVKEITAEILACSEGFSTHEQSTIRLNGGQWDANVEQLQRENEKLGGNAPDPHQSGSGSGGPQQPQEGEEPAEGDNNPHNPENARRRGAEALRGLIISEQIKQSIQGGTANESTT